MKFKNLLVISNNFPNKDNTYTAEIFVKEQIEYLKEYFENIYVISPVAYGVERFRKTHHEDYVIGNVHVHFPKYFNFPLFYNYGRDFWVHFEKKAILKLIKKERISFDIIHAHFTWPSGAAAIKLKENFNVPVVITEHTSLTFSNAIDKKQSQFIRSWELSDAIIRVTKGDMSLFNSVGISLDKVYHITNGYDHMKFSDLNPQNCRKKLGLPLNKKIIVNVGNLYDIAKGHSYLIEAMHEVVMHRDDVLCFIVGGGKLEHKLEKQIRFAGLQDYVKLVGGKSHDEIPLWMSACDIFVLPSLNEGNPTVMFECLACGKPFVGTKVGGVPEIIVSDDYGLLSEPAASNELAENILLALGKEWDNGKIKEYAEQFTWDEISKALMEIYTTKI